METGDITGYERLTIKMAHIQEKGWFYLIRIQDIMNSRGIAAGLDLPDSEEFDLFVDLHLITKATNKTKVLFDIKNRYRYLPSSSTFDYLPKKNRKHDPTVF